MKTNFPEENTTLITGGAGFIGSHLADFLIKKKHKVIVVDNLTYAGSLDNLKTAQESTSFIFEKENICNTQKILQLLETHNPKAIYNLAAESHVDNSIQNASPFIQTNVFGTYSMLTASTTFWQKKGCPPDFRFIHVSTDEVFGHLSENDPPFDEKTPYAPNSPYAASKASSDHFARAWSATYNLPVIVTNCSNNYGPRQHKEKLIPTIVLNALNETPIPIYGNGENIRDWLYVEDHCKGLHLAATKGLPGETYCFGGKNERRNIDIAKEICLTLDQMAPREDGISYTEQIKYVKDRKGHDWRYAIDFEKARKIGFSPSTDHQELIRKTASYYLKTFLEKKNILPKQPPRIKRTQIYKGKNIDLREAALEDSEFIFKLRQNVQKNKHISKTSSRVQDQIEWMKDYVNGKKNECYFIIQDKKKTPLGTVRIYDAKETSFSWGSWIIDNNAPFTAGIESALLTYSYAFNELGFRQSHFDVRKENLKVIEFHKKCGARITREDQRNVYLTISHKEWDKFRTRYEKYLPVS